MSVTHGLTFATIRNGGTQRLGVRVDGGVLDVQAAAAALKLQAPASVDAVIADAKALATVSDIVTRAQGHSEWIIPESKVEWGPCVSNPEKIICVGLNYRRHAIETKAEIPESPVIFSKFQNALNFHGGTVAVSKEQAQKFDYEVELVIVIGKTARDVSEADALKYVFGYCTGDDVSARDLQLRTSQWLLGKTGDGWAPIGPYLVPAAGIDPDNLKLETRVNGEVRQSSNTSDMIFNCSYVISYISRYMTLKPGDIIFTGTPEGVILGYEAGKRVWLKAGDVVTTSVEKLGDLTITLT